MPATPEEGWAEGVELVLDVPLGEEDELEVVVVLVSGSTYCWSPAEVLVPEASAVAVMSSASAASAEQQTRMLRRRRTWVYSSSEARRSKTQPGGCRRSAPGVQQVAGP